jgi:hypothetical protein
VTGLFGRDEGRNGGAGERRLPPRVENDITIASTLPTHPQSTLVTTRVIVNIIELLDHQPPVNRYKEYRQGQLGQSRTLSLKRVNRLTTLAS